jgi:hypothetical protein
MSGLKQLAPRTTKTRRQKWKSNESVERENANASEN